LSQIAGMRVTSGCRSWRILDDAVDRGIGIRLFPAGQCPLPVKDGTTMIARSPTRIVFVRSGGHGMPRHREYRRLMEQIRDAHVEFRRGWAEIRTAALADLSSDARSASWEQVWQA